MTENNLDLLKYFRLVLARPQFPGNMGAVARLASNFDLKQTYLISPFTSTEHSEAKRYATNEGGDYLKNFKTTDSWNVALEECHSAVGFTCRSGVIRTPTISLPDIINLCNSHKRAALVFGNEQVGLTAEELIHCTHICEIPSSPVHRSLNLSHAVGVVLARLFECALNLEGPKEESNLASAVEVNEIVEKSREFIRTLDVQTPPDRAAAHFARILGRAGLTSTEAEFLKDVLSGFQR